MKIQRLCSVQGVMSHFSVIGYSNDDLERQVNKIDSNPMGFISLLCDTCAGKKNQKRFRIFECFIAAVQKIQFQKSTSE